MITKSLIFYVAITLEAFVFCYAGEHLSAKVSAGERNGSDCSILKVSRLFVFLKRKSETKERSQTGT